MQPDTAITAAWAIYALLLAVLLLTVTASVAIDTITIRPARAILAAGLPPAPASYAGRRRNR